MSGPPTTGGIHLAGEPEIVVLDDPDACARATAERIAADLGDAIAARDVAHWATTGGSTPAGIYRQLANDPLRDQVRWDAVELWWGDERFVPRDHPLSNAKVADDVLIDIGALSGSGTGDYGVDVVGGRLPGVPIPPGNVHPVPTAEAIAGSHDTDWCAARYAEMLRADGPPIDGGWPAFDLVLLGIGPDGHVLSVFPGSATFDRSDLVLGVPAPTHVEPHVGRVTLNPAILGAAGSLIVVAHGEAKATIIRDVLHGPRDPRQLPSQLARRAGATWILDRAAARLL